MNGKNVVVESPSHPAAPKVRDAPRVPAGDPREAVVALVIAAKAVENTRKAEQLRLQCLRSETFPLKSYHNRRVLLVA